jgi:hypothetical protein
VIAWWCEVFGGPARYSDELGGYERMLAKHHDLAITPEQRFRFASLMSLAADDAKLPEDPEFRSASWRTSSGEPGSRSTTRSRAPWWWSTRQSHAGGGARRPRFRHSSMQAGACRASSGALGFRPTQASRWLRGRACFPRHAGKPASLSRCPWREQSRALATGRVQPAHEPVTIARRAADDGGPTRQLRLRGAAGVDFFQEPGHRGRREGLMTSFRPPSARTSAEHVAATSTPPHALRERTPGSVCDRWDGDGR